MKKFFKHVLGFIFFIALVSVSFSVGYWFVLHAYPLFHFHLSDYVRYIIAMILGFLVMVGLGISFHCSLIQGVTMLFKR